MKTKDWLHCSNGVNCDNPTEAAPYDVNELEAIVLKDYTREDLIVVRDLVSGVSGGRMLFNEIDNKDSWEWFFININYETIDMFYYFDGFIKVEDYSIDINPSKREIGMIGIFRVVVSLHLSIGIGLSKKGKQIYESSAYLSKKELDIMKEQNIEIAKLLYTGIHS